MRASLASGARAWPLLPGLIDGYCHLVDFMGELYLHLGIHHLPGQHPEQGRVDAPHSAMELHSAALAPPHLVDRDQKA